MSAHGASKPSLIANLRVLLELAGMKSPWWIVVAVLGSIVLAALDTAGVAAMVPLMDLFTSAEPTSATAVTLSRVLGTSDMSALIAAVAGMVALLFVLKSVFTVPFRWWLLGRTTRVSAQSSTELLRRYVASPFVVHRSRKLAETYRNIGDATGQASSVLLGVIGMISDLLTLAAIALILLLSSPLATLFAAAFFGLVMGGVQLLLRRRQSYLGEELAEASLQAWEYLRPALDGFREVRLASVAGEYVDGFGAAKQRQARGLRMLSMVSELPKYVLEIGFVVAIAGISCILFATTTPAAAVATLGVFAAASLRALPTMNRVSATFAIIRTGEMGLRILVEAAESLDVADAYAPEPITGDRSYAGDIEISGVAFHYPDTDDLVLRGVSVNVAEHTTVAFVGSSGAGKSTLLDLVLGLLHPTAGEIRCGGRLIDDDLGQWYAGLGVVPQDVFLLNASLESNVAFALRADEIDRDQVWEALRMAQLDDIVRELPDGLNTVVGERGVRLSGGQRQRLGLARALYRRPTVLVLDEATSALDNQTEHEIASTLHGLRGIMTVIIVAHRLSTVRDADKLVFLENGAVRGEGTFEEVRDSTPAFARLVALGELS